MSAPVRRARPDSGCRRTGAAIEPSWKGDATESVLANAKVPFDELPVCSSGVVDALIMVGIVMTIVVLVGVAGCTDPQPGPRRVFENPACTPP